MALNLRDQNKKTIITIIVGIIILLAIAITGTVMFLKDRGTTEATEAGMEQTVILLGKRENPYPYIKACDLYVQPSRFEGKCVTVREAQMLGKPVVITRYATSADQLEEGVDGVIVPMDNEGCAEGISSLLRDPERMERLVQACRQRDY